ncbi:hypothetical protein SORBI_3001G217850 [Sorghum bicolor]|uniref:Uncharacterized protein n=1 Tax=Sorghum bicolor TaxID=4558 RepID=A0A1Z5S739_SORBI|nr:hypothetical protein SORBI_3001G217850 [Sorghum bicolor]
MPRAARQGDAHGYIHDDAAHTDLDRPPTSQRTAQRRRTRRRTGPLARGRGLPDSNARCSAHGTPLRPVPDFRSPRGARGPPITPCRHRQSPRTRAQALLLQATKLRRLRFTYGMARRWPRTRAFSACVCVRALCLVRRPGTDAGCPHGGARLLLRSAGNGSLVAPPMQMERACMAACRGLEPESLFVPIISGFVPVPAFLSGFSEAATTNGNLFCLTFSVYNQI